MSVELISEQLRKRFRFEERNHATVIMTSDFPQELADLIVCLTAFTLKRSQVVVSGGGRSQIGVPSEMFVLRDREGMCAEAPLTWARLS